MPPSQQSAHVKVGLVLTQVRSEFLRASTSDPDGPARAAKALRRGFELLNCCAYCYRCRPCHDPAAGEHCQGCVEEKGDRLLVASNASVDLGVDGHGEEGVDRMALREAFLESSYLPFASLLLREVGPTWLPIWDSVPTVSAYRFGTRGAAASPAASVSHGDHSEVAPPAAMATHGSVSQGDDSGTDASTPTGSARSLFEAFFRPPAVPPSLALLALCDGLGRQAPEAATTRQLTLAYQLDSGGGGSGGGDDEGALAVRRTPAPDPRTVQHICRLLEPYLQDPPAGQRQTAPQPASPHSGTTSDDGVDQSIAAAVGKLSIDEGGSGEGTLGAAPAPPASLAVSAASEHHRRDEVSLLVQAVMDMADGVGSDEQDRDEAPRDVDARLGPRLFAGGDAADTLASALCLAPQRVANSLGPIAPPDLAPAAFFPAVCGGVVRAILGVRSKRATVSVPQAAGDVWREFTGRLLTAGRAADLANAWLGAMLAGERKHRQDSVDGGATAAAEERAAAWEAWAEEPGGVPEAHAWMVTRLPASRRKSFTEALLRALWPRDGRRHAGPGAWPPGFRTAACRVLVGRPLLSARRRHDQPGAGDESDERGAVAPGGESESSADVSVGLVERLLLQRPLPPPAAEAIAETLAWCDRRRSCAAGPMGAGAGLGAAAGGRGGGAGGGGGDEGGLLMGALKRVAAVWAEPSFLNRSPLRQQEFYTRFLLAALRSGGLEGRLGGTDGDHEALVLLIRGVGSHLDVPARETRLRGMRVGEAVAELGGQSLRFDELDGEREKRRRRRRKKESGPAPAAEEADHGSGEAANGAEGGAAGTVAAAGGGGGAGASARSRGEGHRGERRKGPKRRIGSKGRKRDEGNAVRDDSAAAQERRRLPQRLLPAGWGGTDDGDSDLDPDMLLPLGGEESGSGSDADSMVQGVIEAGDPDSDEDGDSGSTGGSTCTSGDESWSKEEEEEEKARSGNGDGDLGGGGRGEFSLGGAEGEDDDDDDSLEAYDLWDEQDDLAKVADPVYLDQLIELLRSREAPGTVDKHETALKCAEQLIRRDPPDLAHRAPELSRDLLYLENSFDLEDFDALRSGALVATTAAAPESCALYLGSELWSTGATEGTKLQILDVLVQAASELAGWARPSAAGGDGGGNGDGPGGEHPSSSGGSYPSALMQEAKGAPSQGSVRREQKPKKQEPSSARVAAAAAAAVATVASTASTESSKSDGVAAVSSSRRGHGMSMSAGGTTRRWGYRRGPREQLRRNLFGRYAPVFFYPLAQGMVLRLRQSSTAPPPSSTGHHPPPEAGRTIAAAAAAAAAAPDTTPYTLPSATPPPPPPSPLFAARLLHCLTCLVELCGNCPATPALAADLLGLAWLLRGPAADSRELRRAVLIAVATGVERSQDGAASGAVQGQQGEFLRWLQACAQGSDGATRELAGAVLGHSSVQALAFM